MEVAACDVCQTVMARLNLRKHFIDGRKIELCTECEKPLAVIRHLAKFVPWKEWKACWMNENRREYF